jgi:hypothetical protein
MVKCEKFFLLIWFLDPFVKLRKATRSFVMSVGPFAFPHSTTSLPLDGLFIEIRYLSFFENLSGKKNFKFDSNVTRVAGTLH